LGVGVHVLVGGGRGVAVFFRVAVATLVWLGTAAMTSPASSVFNTMLLKLTGALPPY
jgi:hypothetical protein